MAYTPTSWTNGSGQPLAAAPLNKIEQGVKAAHDLAEAAAPASHTHGAGDLTGVVKTVNGTGPDAAGDVTVAGGGGGVLRYPPTVATRLSGNSAKPALASLVPIGATSLPVMGSGGMFTVTGLSIPVGFSFTSVSVNVTTALAQTKRIFLFEDNAGKPGLAVLSLDVDTTDTGVKTFIQSGTLPAGDYWIGVEKFGTARLAGWQWAADYLFPGLDSGSSVNPFFYGGKYGQKALTAPTPENLADLSTYTGTWTRDDNNSAGFPTMIFEVTA